MSSAKSQDVVASSVRFNSTEEERIGLNFKELRKRGLEHLQSLSGSVWTDYNAHDPGVTILEQLCYAITDLSHRSSFDIKDLLADQNGLIRSPNKNALYKPSEIFRTHPVTTLDFRKLLIDHFDEVQNVWVYHTEQMGYEEKLMVTDRIDVLPKILFNKLNAKNALRGEALLKQVKGFIASNRNLAEDVARVRILEPDPIAIDFKVHLSSQQEVELTMAGVLLSLFEYLYSPVPQYTLTELLEKGFKVEEIFSGPALEKGFILDDSLSDHKDRQLGRCLQLDCTDLERLISSNENIAKCEVSEVIRYSRTGNRKIETSTTGIAALEGCFFHMFDDNSDEPLNRLHNNMRVFFNGVAVSSSIFSRERINHKLAELLFKKYRQYSIGSSKDAYYKSQLEGTYRKIANYHSIQEDFPMLYGLGKEGIPKQEPVDRHAKVKQLKAYLLLFEQHMADHLQQTRNLFDFFHLDIGQQHHHTYFKQYLGSVPRVEHIQGNPDFASRVCLYHKIDRSAFLKKKELVDLQQLEGKGKRDYLQFLLADSTSFFSFLRLIPKGQLPASLHPENGEFTIYLEVLAGLNFQWAAREIGKNYWRSAVISFAMLLYAEQKHFTLQVFTEAFVRHLQKMLLPLRKDHLWHKLFENLKRADKLLADDPDFHYKHRYLEAFVERATECIAQWKDIHFKDRKGRVYDHLLARFGEQLDSLPWEIGIRMGAADDRDLLESNMLRDKARYLQELRTLSAEKLKGESFFAAEPGERNPSGLERVIAAKTGIPIRSKRYSIRARDTKEDMALKHFSEEIPTTVRRSMGKLGIKTAQDVVARPLESLSRQLKITTQVLSAIAEQLKAEVDETFYLVDHILLRDFLDQEQQQYGFKFVGPQGEFICGTKEYHSWLELDNRDEAIGQFFKAAREFKKRYHRMDTRTEISPEVRDPEDAGKLIASFAEEVDIYTEWMELVSLFDSTNFANAKRRIRELELIRAKGIADVKRGDYGQRRLIYTRRIDKPGEPGQKVVIDEDFFNMGISIVLPAGRGRFDDQQFQVLLKDIIVERLPVHIRADLLWMEPLEWQKFRSRYQAWELLKAKGEDAASLKIASYQVYRSLKDFKHSERNYK